MKWKATVLIAVLLLMRSLSLGAADGPVVLVEDGRARAVVVLPTGADDVERLAAEELVNYIEKISGARLGIIGQDEEFRSGTFVRILLGRAAQAAIVDLNVDRALGERRDIISCRDGYVIRVEVRAGQAVVGIAGPTSYGTLYGAYELLKKLGCRWFWPGEIGEVVPQTKTIRIALGDEVQVPTFDMRRFDFSPDYNGQAYIRAWCKRNRINLHYPWYAGHNEPLIAAVPDPADLSKWALGTEIIARPYRTDPKRMWMTLGWKDGYQPVSADDALGVRHPWGDDYQSSDVLIKMYNGIAEGLEKKFPDRPIVLGFVAYMNFTLAPISVKPHPSLAPTITPIEQSARHYAGSGRSWERDALIEISRQWCELSNKVFYYDYDPGFLVDGGIPIPSVTRFSREFPMLADMGMRGFFTQIQLSMANIGPNTYMRAQLYWNPHADVDALLDEYYTMLFGPAAESVRTYWDALEEMMHEGPGWQHEDELLKLVYPIEKVRPLGAYIRRAEELTRQADEKTRKRVQMIRFSFDNLMLYLRMRQAEDNADFALAADLAEKMLEMRRAIDKVDDVFYKLGGLDNNTDTADHMPGGWIRQNQERNKKINGELGDLVAMTADEWQFSIDPHDEGIVYHWFDPSFDVRKWRTILTSQIWEIQELHDKEGRGYDGVGWYRTTVKVPGRFAGRKINLGFGGAFGKMLIWVNGQFVDYRPFKLPWFVHRYNQNFDIELTEAIKPGQDNTIVIRVDNEHEWGGIYRRVCLWSPKSAAK